MVSAAEYLPKDLAETLGVNQDVDYERFYDLLESRAGVIDELYAKLVTGEFDKEELPEELASFFPPDRKLIPMYRIKVPSSLNAAREEPPGVDKIQTFLKLVSLMGGKTLFIDESTRSAPRSIECLYNILNRRQEQLGGVDLRLFGKINGATGQNSTHLVENYSSSANIEVGFLDPWEAQEKSYTDDTVGFVPEVGGAGVIEIVKPSYVFVGPSGVSTVQDFWKTLIALEVSKKLREPQQSQG